MAEKSKTDFPDNRAAQTLEVKWDLYQWAAKEVAQGNTKGVIDWATNTLNEGHFGANNQRVYPDVKPEDYLGFYTELAHDLGHTLNKNAHGTYEAKANRRHAISSDALLHKSATALAAAHEIGGIKESELGIRGEDCTANITISRGKVTSAELNSK